jgi:hypothetical protein
VVAAIALVAVPAADGKWNRHAFDKHVARSGDVIHVSIGFLPVATSSPWSNRRVVKVSIYLVPLDLAGRWWPSYTGTGFGWGKPLALPGVTKLGSLDVSAASLPLLGVRVPPAVAGSYVLGYWAAGARWTSARRDNRLDPYGILHVRFAAPRWLLDAERVLLARTFGHAKPVRVSYIPYPKKIAVVFEFAHVVICGLCSSPTAASQPRGRVIRVSFDRRTHRLGGARDGWAMQFCEIRDGQPPKSACFHS